MNTKMISLMRKSPNEQIPEHQKWKYFMIMINASYSYITEKNAVYIISFVRSNLISHFGC